jgi:hypothetical protein
MFVGLDRFIEHVNDVRLVYISGLLGSHKTALAFALALELVKRYGYRYVISNVDSVITQPLNYVEYRDSTFLDSVVIYDEGGLFMRFRSQAESLVSFARKLNIIILIPSKAAVSRSAYDLHVHRTMDLTRLGFPALLYRYTVKTYPVTQGTFWWVYPHKMYGVYNTVSTPDNDAGIGRFLQDAIGRLRKISVEGYTMDGSVRAPTSEGFGDLLSLLEDSSKDL